MDILYEKNTAYLSKKYSVIGCVSLYCRFPYLLKS